MKIELELNERDLLILEHMGRSREKVLAQLEQGVINQLRHAAIDVQFAWDGSCAVCGGVTTHRSDCKPDNLPTEIKGTTS